MIQYLFVRLPSLFFEPISVGALLGGITASWYYRKNKKRFYWILIVCICLMFFWRLSSYSLMLSTRYASILLYPAIILTAWFCSRSEEILRSGIQCVSRYHNQIMGKICLVLPCFLITGLAVAGLIKILHYDPYGGHTVNLCSTLARETAGKDFMLYAQSEQQRISYYSGIDYQKIMFLNYKTNLPLQEQLKSIITLSKNHFDNIYFVFSLKKGDPEPDAQTLEIGSELGTWECIHREITSRKKKKELILYRFIPAHPNIEIWEKDIPEISPDNHCLNGDFENCLAGKDLEERLNYYRQLGAADFYLAPERRFPLNWWLVVEKERDGLFSKISLTEEHPIAGKYSLEMNSNNGANWGTNCALVPKQDGVFSGFIRAESDASVLIRSCYWDLDKSTIGYITDYAFRLHPGKTYRFSFPVHMADVPEEDRSINFVVQGIGHILLDNFELIQR